MHSLRSNKLVEPRACDELCADEPWATASLLVLDKTVLKAPVTTSFKSSTLNILHTNVTREFERRVGIHARETVYTTIETKDRLSMFSKHHRCLVNVIDV